MRILRRLRAALNSKHLGRDLLGERSAVTITGIEASAAVVGAVVELADAGAMGAPKSVLFAPTRSRRSIISSTICFADM
jgi:hypothetical protein